jgi:hypothetical protein
MHIINNKRAINLKKKIYEIGTIFINDHLWYFIIIINI